MNKAQKITLNNNGVQLMEWNNCSYQWLTDKRILIKHKYETILHIGEKYYLVIENGISK